MADIDLDSGVTVTVSPPQTPTILSGPPRTTATIAPPVTDVTIGAPLTPGLFAGVGGTATVMPGTAGPAGADGAPGPQGEPGPPGADGEGGGSPGGRLLSGTSAPASSSGLQDLDGINDPWRWVTAPNNFWIGPAYEVTWEAGDTFDAPDRPDPGADISIYVVTDTTLSGALGVHGATPMENQIQDEGTSLWSTSVAGIVSLGFHTVGSPPVRGFMTESGSGIAFIVQFEADYGGPTEPPYPDEDITTLLGDLVVGDPYEFPVETGDGDDGDWWLNKTTMQLYGPKAGTWPSPNSVKGFDLNANYSFTGYWTFAPADPASPAFFVQGGTEPDAGYLADSQLGMWYDPTADAPAVHFKAKDAAGTVSDIQLHNGGRLLSGTTAPLSGSGLDPLDGTSDPWRWSTTLGGWVGPAYDITWLTGDEVPIPPTLPAGAEQVDVRIGTSTSPGDYPALFLFSGNGGAASTLLYTGGTAGPITADADGAGIAFAFQVETGFGGPTTVPDPSIDITTMLGDVTAGALHTWDETGDGDDGDWWLNKTTMQLYGPKTAGAWPAPNSVKGFIPSAYTIVTGGWNFQTSDPANPALTVEGTTEPDNGYLNNGQVAMWYDPTAAAPVVNFKAKDAAGDVYVAQLPMTPA